MLRLSLLLLLPLALACNQDTAKPIILEKNGGFDLATINFTEDVESLYSAHILNENGVEYDSARDGALTDSILKYTISNMMTDAVGFKIPAKDFGYRYKSPELDSIAKFKSAYFNAVQTLTNLKKEPVAYYSEATFNDYKLRKVFLVELIAAYGKPTNAYYISSEFNQCSYEWDVTDRKIQVETSFGWGLSASSDGETTSGKYYRLDVVIVSKKAEKAIYDAHVFAVPDQIMYEGKLHSSTDFQLDKELVVPDIFLLNSTNKTYTEDENGIYDISRAEEDE